MIPHVVAASLALQAAAVQAPVSPVPDRGPARAVVDSVVAAELRFFYEWGQAWRLNAGERLKAVLAEQTPTSRTLIPRADFEMLNAAIGSVQQRNSHLHCHPAPARAGPGTAVWDVRHNSMIRTGGPGLFAVCPTWAFDELTADERLNIDAGLSPEFRNAIVDARRSVLAVIDAAARAMPEDPFLVGQGIRFLVDLGALDSALSAAGQCRAGRWWCNALTGYVLAKRKEWIAAEAAFDSALASLNDRERCRWTHLGALLEASARAEYDRESCAARDSTNARIWWLADPLWSDPGNVRRIEHYERLVFIALKRALDRDERYDWRYAAGGDALEEMVLRYGWPSFMWWGGFANDKQHSGYLKGRRSAMPGPLHEPYTTFEYSTKRQHLFPGWTTVLDPLRAKTNDWQINAPLGERSEADAHAQWWPLEHYAAPHPLYQLSDGQVAMLRRDSTILLATATDLLRSGVPRALGSRVTAKLVVSHEPGAVQVVAEHDGPLDKRLVLFGNIASRPTLMGVELPRVEPLRVAARSRFGIEPPPPLSAMAMGELAISDPVLLMAPPDGEPAPTETNAALQMMSATGATQGVRRIGVYWETYGFKPADSVDVAVWIERYTAQGLARRFANALQITTDLNTPVATSWREPRPGTRMNVIDGRIPVIGRSLVLDVSRLPRGSYWLDVAVAKPGQPPVRGRRNVVIQ